MTRVAVSMKFSLEIFETKGKLRCAEIAFDDFDVISLGDELNVKRSIDAQNSSTLIRDLSHLPVDETEEAYGFCQPTGVLAKSRRLAQPRCGEYRSYCKQSAGSGLNKNQQNDHTHYGPNEPVFDFRLV